MFVYVLKFLKTFTASHKKEGLFGFIGFAFIIVSGWGIDFFAKMDELSNSNLSKINEITPIVMRNEIKSDNLQVQMRSTVKREDWVAYIQRKDDEYHIQQQYNTKDEGQIGDISGRLKDVEELLYEVNQHDLTNEENKTLLPEKKDK